MRKREREREREREVLTTKHLSNSHPAFLDKAYLLCTCGKVHTFPSGQEAVKKRANTLQVICMSCMCKCVCVCVSEKERGLTIKHSIPTQHSMIKHTSALVVKFIHFQLHRRPSREELIPSRSSACLTCTCEYVCRCGCVCAWVCVCVCERERKRERERVCHDY